MKGLYAAAANSLATLTPMVAASFLLGAGAMHVAGNKGLGVEKQRFEKVSKKEDNYMRQLDQSKKNGEIEQAQIKALTQELQKHLGTIHKLESTISQSNLDLTTTKTEIEKCIVDKQGLRDKYIVLGSENTMLQRQLEKQKTDYSKLKDIISSYDEILRESHNELKESIHRFQNLKEKYDNLVIKNISLQQQLKSKKKDIEDLSEVSFDLSNKSFDPSDSKYQSNGDGDGDGGSGGGSGGGGGGDDDDDDSSGEDVDSSDEDV